MFLKILKIIVTFFCFEGTFACSYNNMYTRYECASFTDLRQEASVSWETVYIYKVSSEPLLTLLPEHLEKTPNIYKLIVHGWLQNIQTDAFKALHRLEDIILFDNNITTLNPPLFRDTKIKLFYGKNIGLTQLSKGLFDGANHMNNINLDLNHIETITVGVFNGTSIGKIQLTRNNIHVIEDGAFHDMPFLTVLILAGNHLLTFNSYNLVSRNNKISYISLSSNLLTNVTTDVVGNLHKLEYCELDLNSIQYIVENTFAFTPSLKYLDIANNQLLELHPDILPKSQLTKMHLIYLNNNKLTYINFVFFARMPNLSYISLGGNPWQCACLSKIDDWLVEKNIRTLCDHYYREGHRPTCVFSTLTSSSCIQDEYLNEELHQLYMQGMQEYPTLNQTCDITNGVNDSKLVVHKWKRPE